MPQKGPLLISILRHHRATCQQTQQSIKSYPVVLIALPLTPAACLLRAWLLAGYAGVAGNNLNSIEWRVVVRGAGPFPPPSIPLHPNSHKHPVSLWVMGWSQAPDTPPAHCLPACPGRAGLCWYSWGRQRCREVKWLDRGQSTSLNHTRTNTHIRSHACRLTVTLNMFRTSFFAGTAANFSSDKCIVCTSFSFVQECVYETSSDCLFFLPL